MSIPLSNVGAKQLTENITQPKTSAAWQGGLGPAGVNLIAMIVSDSGLASAQPQWWNSSVKGCVFIGLQPRGGWQVMQRAVQWDSDFIASTFGVSCTKPYRYAYFACTIRNRLEKWDSRAWSSPTEGIKAATGWKDIGMCHVRRPTKLIDGSRGGQAFICDLLLPEKNATYTIENQARMQFRSVLLVAAGLMNADGLGDLDNVLEDDFQLSDKLGIIFQPLLISLIVANVVVIALSIAVIYSTLKVNIFGRVTPFIFQAASLLLWMVAATGLLMLGGNPRVKMISTPDDMPAHILERLAALETTQSKEGTVQIRFGTIHGSGYTDDHGYCTVPFDVVARISSVELVAVRPKTWVIGMGWWSICLLLSIGMQIMAAQIATVWSEIFSVTILLITALARGYGVTGPEEWMIPSWKSRSSSVYGASLLGKMEARTN